MILIFRFHLEQLGNDEWGQKYAEHLKKFNVCAKHVGQVSEKTTGIAQINVAESGENQIVIIPGANDLLSPADIENAAETLDSCKVIIFHENAKRMMKISSIFFIIFSRCSFVNWKHHFRLH